jgi:heme exporter protein B
MEILSKTWLLYRKDVLLEARTKITLLSVILFSLLVLLIFNFSFKINSSSVDSFASGILWITVSFSGVIILSRIFDHERIRWCFKGILISPADRLSVFLSKFLVHLSFTVLIELLSIALFIFLFNPKWEAFVVLKVFGIFVLSTVGFSAVGVLISTMLFNERLK